MIADGLLESGMSTTTPPLELVITKRTGVFGTGLPNASAVLSTGGFGIGEPVVAKKEVGVAGIRMRLAAGPVVLLNGLLLMAGSEPLFAISTKPLPISSTLRSSNVAAPLTALRASVPPRLASYELSARTSVTTLTAIVGFPPAS